MSYPPHEFSADDIIFVDEEEPALGKESRDLVLVQAPPLAVYTCEKVSLGLTSLTCEADGVVCGIDQRFQCGLWPITGCATGSVGKRPSKRSRDENCFSSSHRKKISFHFSNFHL